MPGWFIRRGFEKERIQVIGEVTLWMSHCFKGHGFSIRGNLFLLLAQRFHCIEYRMQDKELSID
jgi:hypothetical protein